MPWTADDPPPPARKWPKAERERCVAAANSVLEDGGSDEEAVHACIAAAGRSKPKMNGAQPSEHKTFPAFQTKIDDEQGIVESIVAVFGNTDLGDDVIHPGAFTKTLTERGLQIKVLDAHNTDSLMRVIGKPLELREMARAELPPALLARFPSATGGLMTRTQFLMATPEGRGAFERLKADAVNEWSIGYDAILHDWTRENGKMRRNLRELRLWEYSPVLWGMNPATVTLSAKGADGDVADEEGDVTKVADGADDTKAEWTAAEINDLPDASFAVVEPGGSKDDDGRTTPRSLRHLPHHGPDGKVDLPHLRSSRARLSQSKLSDALKATAGAHLDRHAKAESVGEEAEKLAALLSAAKAHDAAGEPYELEPLLAAADTLAAQVKEMTPYGPVQRLGDVLQGTIHQQFTWMADSWYINGLMNRDERIALSSLIGDALDVLAAGMPAELAQRECGHGGAMMGGYMAAPGPEGEKAGRVLSGANTRRILAAIASINEVLEAAGMMVHREGDDDEDMPHKPPKDGGDKAADGPGATRPPETKGNEAGPPGAPTSEDEQRWLLEVQRALVEGALEEVLS